MKKNALLLYFLFLCTPILVISQDIYEPNDEIADAAQISCDGNYQGFIQSIGDQDWYKVDVSESGILQADLSADPNDLDLRIETYEWDGIGIPARVSNDNFNSVGNDTPVSSITYVNPGTYYILIYDENNNQANDTDHYTLTITCISNSFEINQTIDLAAAIPTDTCLQDYIFGENETFDNTNDDGFDEDWFKVTVTESGVLEANLAGDPIDLDLRIETFQWDGVGIPIKVSDDNYSSVGNDTPVSSVTYLNPGTYYIHIYDENFNQTSPDPYTFCVSFHPNQHEINQTIDLATAIPSDTCFQDFIWGENETFSNTNDDGYDEDWFKVTITESGILEANLAGDPIDLDLRIETFQWDGIGIPVRVSDDNYFSVGSETPVSSIAYLNPGTYYIHIYDDGFNQTSPDPYTFCVSFHPNQFEINQTIDLAAAIPADTCFQDNIWGENETFDNTNDDGFDEDWFKVTVSESGVLEANLAGDPIDLDLRIETFQWDGTGIPVRISDDNFATIGPSTPVSSIAYVNPGTYYIHIYDENFNETSSNLYSFCVGFHPNQYEINQTIELAAAVPSDTCFHDNIWGENETFTDTNDDGLDEDWFKVEIDTACNLKIELTNVPDDLDLNLEIIQLMGIQQEIIADDGDNNSVGGQELTAEIMVEPGTYYIHIEDENNNETSMEQFIVCISCEVPVSTTRLNAAPILLFPNPADEALYIDGILSEMNYTIFDTNGRVLKSSFLTENKIDISEMNSGIYILKLFNDNSQYIQKFSKR